jgi:hypothetical protein
VLAFQRYQPVLSFGAVKYVHFSDFFNFSCCCGFAGYYVCLHRFLEWDNPHYCTMLVFGL